MQYDVRGPSSSDPPVDAGQFAAWLAGQLVSLHSDEQRMDAIELRHTFDRVIG